MKVNKYRYKGRYDVFLDGYQDEPLTPFDITINAANRESADKKFYESVIPKVDPHYYDVLINYDIKGEIEP